MERGSKPKRPKTDIRCFMETPDTADDEDVESDPMEGVEIPGVGGEPNPEGEPGGDGPASPPPPAIPPLPVAAPANIDIGNIFTDGIRNLKLISDLTDNDKGELLNNHYMPPENFKYPYSIKKQTGRPDFKVHLSRKYLTGAVYGCFKYSPILDGVVCVPCALFAREDIQNDRKKPTHLGQLVNSPLKRYNKLTAKKKGGDLTDHLATQYHQNAQTDVDNFNVSMATKVNIRTVMDTERTKHVAEQRARLAPIIKTTILCGRIGIGYRGRRDDGMLDPDQPIAQGDGNFRSLLLFRVESGDKDLENHLRTAGKNATYISKTTQNELIGICGDIVLETIMRSVNVAQYFSVIADETTDKSHREQLCICVRYVDMVEEKHQVREEFIDFHTAEDLTGAGLANQIITTLQRHGADLTKLVGQGYDGAAAMSGHINGVQTHIRAQAPAALYVHCGSHTLNLVLNSASSVPEIRNMFGDVREVTNFINSSGPRRDELKKVMGEGHRSLKTLCETRFVERHDSLIIFQEAYSSIVKCLEAITKAKDRKTSDKAHSLLKATTDSGFIVALCCAKKLMAFTIGLSESLQKVNSDLFGAIASVTNVKNTVDDWRADVDGKEWSDGRTVHTTLMVVDRAEYGWIPSYKTHEDLATRYRKWVSEKE